MDSQPHFSHNLPPLLHQESETEAHEFQAQDTFESY
jgi:serine/threonine protein kinase